MSAPNLDDLDLDQTRVWLARALRGEVGLFQLTQDESPYLGVLRLAKTSKPRVADSLREASLQLLRQFCTGEFVEATFAEQLLSLSAKFQQPEAAHMLAQTVRGFPESSFSEDLRLAILSALVDMNPPQSVAFWKEILEQNGRLYAPLVLSGVLAASPTEAIALLPAFPNEERLGRLAAIKLGLKFDALPAAERPQFARDVRSILSECPSSLARPIKAWVDSKKNSPTSHINASLSEALDAFLGKDSAPSVLSPKLCPV